jgi:CheY-like chemotaxis protein
MEISLSKNNKNKYFNNYIDPQIILSNTLINNTNHIPHRNYSDKKKHILIIYDDKLQLKIYESLESLYANTNTLPNGEKVLVTIKHYLQTKNKITLILTDKEMALFNGLYVVKTVHSHFPQIPIIVHTSTEILQDQKIFITTGSERVNIKPHSKNTIKLYR